MILSNYMLNAPIVFEEGKICILAIENQTVYSQSIGELCDQCAGKHGNFVLSEDGIDIDFSKSVSITVDPFSLDINSKPIQTKYQAVLKNEFIGEDHYCQTNEMLAQIQTVLESVLEKMPFPTVMNDIDISALLKAANVRFDLSAGSLLERIINYMSICSQYCNTRLFIFVNIKTMLSQEDLREFYLFIFYGKYNVLLMENFVLLSLPQESVRVIDKDLCELTNTENDINLDRI